MLFSRRHPPTHKLILNAPQPSLEAAARTALAGGQSRARLFEHNGQRYVVKRLADQSRGLMQILFMRWLVKRITGQPLPLRTLALNQAAGGMDYEAKRLIDLAAKGVRVPQVALVMPEFFVLDYCGTVIATLLESWEADTWRRELVRQAQELGEFHAAGHWHGGAQIKNVTLQDGQAYRIDFEENFGEYLPLAASQAADLVLFLNSISLAGPIHEAEARTLLPRLLDAYFAAHPAPEVKAVIRRTAPMFQRFARFAGLFQRWSRKGIRRVIILSDILSSV